MKGLRLPNCGGHRVFKFKDPSKVMGLNLFLADWYSSNGEVAIGRVKYKLGVDVELATKEHAGLNAFQTRLLRAVISFYGTYGEKPGLIASYSDIRSRMRVDSKGNRGIGQSCKALYYKGITDIYRLVTYEARAEEIRREHQASKSNQQY